MKDNIKLILREELLKILSEQEINELELLNEGRWANIIAGALTFLSVAAGNFGEHKPNPSILNLNNQQKKEVAVEHLDEYQTLVKSLDKFQSLEFKTMVNQAKDTIFMALNHKNTPNKESIIQKINKTVFVEADGNIIDSIVDGRADGFFTVFNNKNYIFVEKGLTKSQTVHVIIHEMFHDIDFSVDDEYESKNEFMDKNKTKRFSKLDYNKDFSNNEKGLTKYLDNIESIIRNIDTLSVDIKKMTGIDYLIDRDYIDWLQSPEEHYAELQAMKDDLVKMGIMSSFKDDVTTDEINFLLSGSNQSKAKFKEFTKKEGLRNWMAMLPLITKDKVNNLVNYLNKF